MQTIIQTVDTEEKKQLLATYCNTEGQLKYFISSPQTKNSSSVDRGSQKVVIWYGLVKVDDH